jgi:DNA-binding protein HU-beta
MNTTDFAKEVGKKLGTGESGGKQAVKAIMEVITEAMQNGEKVSLIGFGSFEVQNRPARAGRNPQTGATIQVPAKNIVKFKPGSNLQDAIN